jgi:hypothetical protein
MAAIEFATVQAALALWVRTGSGLATGKVFWTAGKPLAEAPYLVMSMPTVGTVARDWTEDARKPLVLADDTIEEADTGTGELMLTAHAYLTGDGPVRFTTTDTLPTPLEIDTDYWLVKAGANAVRVADTFRHAIAAVPTTITLTDEGVGTNKIVDTALTVRAGQEMTTTAKGLRRLSLTLQCFALDATGLGHARAYLHALVARAALPSMSAILDAANLALLEFSDITTMDLIEQTTVFRPRAVVIAEFYTTSEISEDGTIIESVEVTSLLTGHTRVYGD